MWVCSAKVCTERDVSHGEAPHAMCQGRVCKGSFLYLYFSTIRASNYPEVAVEFCIRDPKIEKQICALCTMLNSGWAITGNFPPWNTASNLVLCLTIAPTLLAALGRVAKKDPFISNGWWGWGFGGHVKNYWAFIKYCFCWSFPVWFGTPEAFFLLQTTYQPYGANITNKIPLGTTHTMLITHGTYKQTMQSKNNKSGLRRGFS